MKKIIIAATVVFTTMLAMTSCELEGSNNGELDGYWHIERIDTLATGGVADYSQDLFFWAFQGKLLSLSCRNHNATDCLTRFNKTGGTLTISEPFRYDRMGGDEPLETPELLQPYGINKTEESFAIESLSGSKMILKSETLRISFKKL